MGKSGSIFSRKISVYKEYYHRDFIASTSSLANILSIMIWIIILCVPFIVVFSKGKFILLTNIHRPLAEKQNLCRAAVDKICG